MSIGWIIEDKETDDDNSPADLLDNLFRKTKTTPCLYWLPLTTEQVIDRLNNKSLTLFVIMNYYLSLIDRKKRHGKGRKAQKKRRSPKKR